MLVNPESSLGLLLRLAGAGSFLILPAGVVASTLVAAVARLRGRGVIARRAGIAAVVLAGTYALLLVAGPTLLGGRTLQPGEELAFCGLDCHLHLTTTQVTRNGEVAVVVRARSDAREAPEDPRYVELSVVDERGHRYLPDSMTFDRPLGPGDSYERTLTFKVPSGASGLRLVGTWTGWPAYAIPGPDNIFVQRQSGILLAPDSVAS